MLQIYEESYYFFWSRLTYRLCSWKHFFRLTGEALSVIRDSVLENYESYSSHYHKRKQFISWRVQCIWDSLYWDFNRTKNLNLPCRTTVSINGKATWISNLLDLRQSEEIVVIVTPAMDTVMKPEVYRIDAPFHQSTMICNALWLVRISDRASHHNM